MVIGLGLIRLHALRGSYWVGFYGGLALIVGSYFAVTAFPGLSPFEHAVAAGWSLIVVGHFWTLASAERSPLRTGMQAFGAIEADAWHQMRSGWGYVVRVAIGNLRTTEAHVRRFEESWLEAGRETDEQLRSG